MAILELNLRAKQFSYKTDQLKRRREMAIWRKKKRIHFVSMTEVTKWFDYTKWHKRPYTVHNAFGIFTVEFLDDMKGAK